MESKEDKRESKEDNRESKEDKRCNLLIFMSKLSTNYIDYPCIHCKGDRFYLKQFLNSCSQSSSVENCSCCTIHMNAITVR